MGNENISNWKYFRNRIVTYFHVSELEILPPNLRNITSNLKSRGQFIERELNISFELNFNARLTHESETWIGSI
jgi:hypothetical protein